MTGTSPFILVRHKPRGWVRRRTDPKLSTVVVELAPEDVLLPRDWEPTTKVLRRNLEQRLVGPWVALGVIVLAAAAMLSS